MSGAGEGVGRQFGDEDAGEDKGGSGRGSGLETFAEKEKRDKPGEDGLEGEQERGVGGRKMLLGPALNGEGGGGGEEAGDGKRDDEARSEVEMKWSSERKRDEP